MNKRKEHYLWPLFGNKLIMSVKDIAPTKRDLLSTETDPSLTPALILLIIQQSKHAYLYDVV